MTVRTFERPVPLPLGSVQGALALDLAPRHDPPPLGRAPGRRGGDAVTVDVALRRRLEQWSHRYAQAVVEIVEGDRPVTQVVRWTRPSVYADLSRRAQLVARAAGRTDGVGRPAPAIRPQVCGVRTCFVSDTVLEAGIHVRYGQRSRAVAARFELVGGRWQCSALEFA
jgi:Family of unknown function (DUF6459)